MMSRNEILGAALALIGIVLASSLVIAGVIRFTDISAAIAYVLVAEVIAALVWGFSPRVVKLIKQESKNGVYSVPSVTTKSKSVSVSSLDSRSEARSRVVFDSRAFEISGGGFKKIQLDVSNQDRIQGHLVERNGYEFDWYITDERNLTRFINKDDFTFMKGGDYDRAPQISWKVPKDGPWFLILSNRGRSVTRVVEVTLRCLA